LASPHIIGITGNKGSGKNTVADIIGDLYHDPDKDLRFNSIAFADPIREKINYIFKLNGTITAYDDFKRSIVSTTDTDMGSHSVSGRHVVREIGMLMRYYNPNQFVDYVEDKINFLTRVNYIVTDLRFDNELEFLKRKNAFIVKVVRDEDTATDSHITERGFDDSQCDVVIYNNGSIEELTEKVRAVFDKFYRV
jgi:hypothetical protein